MINTVVGNNISCLYYNMLYFVYIFILYVLYIDTYRFIELLTICGQILFIYTVSNIYSYIHTHYLQLVHNFVVNLYVCKKFAVIYTFVLLIKQFFVI